MGGRIFFRFTKLTTVSRGSFDVATLSTAIGPTPRLERLHHEQAANWQLASLSLRTCNEKSMHFIFFTT